MNDAELKARIVSLEKKVKKLESSYQEHEKKMKKFKESLRIFLQRIRSELSIRF